MTSLTLDHVGYVGAAIEAMRADFARLGFAPTAPETLMRSDPVTGERASLGQSSCHTVFTRGYVELTAVHAPAPGHHLYPYRTLGPGVQILAFGVQSIAAAHAQCTAAGLAASAPAWAARPIVYGLFHGEARFHWFMVEPQDSPDALVCFVRNETPELLYQPEVTRHPNGAQALEEVVLVASDLPETVWRYERMLGFEAVLDGQTARFALAQGQLAVMSPVAFGQRFAGLPAPAPDRIALVAVRTAEAAAARRELAAHAIAFTERGGELLVPPPAACGAALALRPGR